MYCRDVGEGGVVLLLHGTPSPAEDWMPLAHALAPRHRVLVPDLPGYGRSEALSDAAVESVGDAIFALLHGRGIEALDAIVGYSSGAYRAFDLALRHALPVKLICSLGGVSCFDGESRELRRALALRLASEPSYLQSEEVRAIMIQLMISDGWRANHPEDEERVARWIDVTTPAALAQELEALARSRDLRPELPRLRAPVYARVGEHDRGCPPEWSADIVASVERGSVDVVPGCGHALLVEDLAGTVAAVVEQIARAR